MKTLKALMSSNSNEWETPDDVFNKLDEEFHFTLDPCATKQNRKCKRYITKDQDGLKQSWVGETVFVNPPYGREIKNWVIKAYNEMSFDNTIIVMLIPARTDTSYFHDYIYEKKNITIRFLKGRIKFLKNKKQSSSAPFPSMIVIFK